MVTSSEQHHPVFFDPRGVRAPTITGLLMGLVVLALAGVGALLVGLYVTAVMPEAPHPALEAAVSLIRPLETTAPPTPGPAIDPARNRQLPADAVATRRWAFLPNDIDALASLRRHAHKLDAVVADLFILGRGDDGRVAVRRGGETLRTVAHPASRARLVRELTDVVAAGGFAGLVLELHDLATAQNRVMATLLRELEGPLRAAGARLIVAASVGDAPHRLQAIAPLVDAVLLHAHGGYPAWNAVAPPASQAWFEDRLAAALAALPRDKLVVSIGSYGVDPRHHDYRRVVSVQRGWDLARAWSGAIRLDRDALNSYLAFRGASGRPARLRMLDAASAFNQARAAMAAGVHGVALWRLGTEDPGVWSFLGRGRLPTIAALDEMRSVPGGHGSLAFARGALIGVAEGEAGERDFAFHAGLGLVTDQTFTRVATARRFTEWPIRAPDAVALTFDDGPDPRFTPRVTTSAITPTRTSTRPRPRPGATRWSSTPPSASSRAKPVSAPSSSARPTPTTATAFCRRRRRSWRRPRGRATCSPATTSTASTTPRRPPRRSANASWTACWRAGAWC